MIESEAPAAESSGAPSTGSLGEPTTGDPAASASAGVALIRPLDGRMRRPGYRCGIPCEQCFEGTCNGGKPFQSHHNCLRCHKGEGRA